jgi:hypothetical protein
MSYADIQNNIRLISLANEKKEVLFPFFSFFSLFNLDHRLTSFFLFVD